MPLGEAFFAAPTAVAAVDLTVELQPEVLAEQGVEIKQLIAQWQLVLRGLAECGAHLTQVSLHGGLAFVFRVGPQRCYCGTVSGNTNTQPRGK